MSEKDIHLEIPETEIVSPPIKMCTKAFDSDLDQEEDDSSLPYPLQQAQSCKRDMTDSMLVQLGESRTGKALINVCLQLVFANN